MTFFQSSKIFKSKSLKAYVLHVLNLTVKASLLRNVELINSLKIFTFFLQASYRTMADQKTCSVWAIVSFWSCILKTDGFMTVVFLQLRLIIYPSKWSFQNCSDKCTWLYELHSNERKSLKTWSQAVGRFFLFHITNWFSFANVALSVSFNTKQTKNYQFFPNYHSESSKGKFSDFYKNR